MDALLVSAYEVEIVARTLERESHFFSLLDTPSFDCRPFYNVVHSNPLDKAVLGKSVRIPITIVPGGDFGN